LRRLGLEGAPPTSIPPYGTGRTCLFQVVDQYQDG
jgi:hypothetical protein